MNRFAHIAFVLTWAFLGLGGLALAAPYEQGTTQTTTLSPTVTPSRTSTHTRTSSVTVALTTTATPATTRPITSTVVFTQSATPTTTLMAPPNLSATATTTPTATATPTVYGTPTPTPIRYPLSLDPNILSIDSLRARPYGGTGVKITKTVATNEAYRQVLIEYSSDGLRITGEMNIPRGIGPFPVVILDHGYFKPAEYKTGDGSNRAADAFARRGYLTLAPDYRCYAGSQCAANPLYVGYAIDVLNLIAQLSTVPDADTSRLGIWGHSMGGGITLRVLAVNDSVKVASLYGALSADDEAHYCWLIGCSTPTAARTPSRDVVRQAQRFGEADPDFLQNASPLGNLHTIFLRSSPSRYLSNITAATIIHHGEADDIVPIEWSVDLANQLNSLGRRSVLYTYPGEGHVFAGWGWQLFMTRSIAFFDEYLKPRDSIVTVERRVLRQERIAAEQRY